MRPLRRPAQCPLSGQSAGKPASACSSCALRAERVRQTGQDHRVGDGDIRVAGATGATRMRVLAGAYPELEAFTPDATLVEIKNRYGLNTLEQVRELGRRRQQQRSSHAQST